MNYTAHELLALGITFGKNVVIHRSVELFNPAQIKLGSNVRIDCFCVISAGKPIIVGNNVHIAAGASIFGSEGVEIGDFAGLSARTAIFTASDDYSGGHMTNPTVPDKFRRVTRGRVILQKHVIVGFGSAILPNVTLSYGAAVGALSLVARDIPEFAMVSGIPARMIAMRNAELLRSLEQDFYRDQQSNQEIQGE